MQIPKRCSNLFLALIGLTAVLFGPGWLVAQDTGRPWMDPQLSSKEQADMVLKQLTLDEKLALLHGNGIARNQLWTMPLTDRTNGGAGYVEGVERLGIPPLVISDAGYGVRDRGSPHSESICILRTAVMPRRLTFHGAI